MAVEYIAVSIDNIPVGLELDCKAYVKKGEEFAYLCENVTITDALLERFRKAADDPDNPDNPVVYIASNYLEAFLKRGVDLGWVPEPEKEPEPVAEAPPPKPKKSVKPPPPSPEFEEVKRQYIETKVKAESMFAKIAESGKVDSGSTDDFVLEIGEKLETNDISLIIDSINNIRSVDEYLHTHSLNVAFLNGLMAKWLRYDKKRHDELVKTGLLHDIGKLLIPDSILNKPARLTKEEFETIKKHSVLSFEMLVNSGIREKALLLGIVQHHEKLNGSGYPHGLTAKDITDFARITSISDIYDAMIAKRAYKDAQSPFTILENFAEEGYSMLDIKLVKLFIDCMIGELKGKFMVLSDGSVAKVAMVNERNLKYPMMELEDGTIISTTPELYCVRMYNADISAEEVAEIYKE
ncbi:MAG: HD-GYP domain-containing protein [Oscillospiraceae bacterium]|nr:HD-GYP domain-containing protein [Oscillospiraceae bacterium]